MDIISFGLASKVNKAIKDLIGDSKLTIPSGTTADRPVLLAGDKAVRFNTDTNGLEEWNGIEWKNVSAKISAVRIKGTDTVANILAMVGMVAEDLWIASDTLDGYVYDGSVWINIGPLRGAKGDTGLTGDTGATGNGIDTIVRTVGDGSAGTTDEYTITFTDTTTTTFSVYNGSNGLTVDHITRTVGTGAAGSTDTYTAYADVGETTELGSFNVYNGADGLLASIVGGTGVTIDNTDPANPIINVGDILPSQIGKAGKYLKTDGTTASWESASTGTGVTNNEFIATAGQTEFAVAYSVGNLDVYQNGLLLSDTDYVATNGTSVVLVLAAKEGDLVSVKVYDTFSVADTYMKAEVNDALALKADVTYVDSALVNKADKATTYTKSDTDAKIDAVINDTETTTTNTWSSDKIDDEITTAVGSIDLSSKQDTLVSGTNIKTINGESVLGSGNIVTPNTITTVNNTLTSTSTTQALSAAQGKVLQNSKQATLVSGTNIKTIAGNTLLGSGDIDIADFGSYEEKYNYTPVKTTAYQAMPRDVIPCNTTAGVFTVALPSTPRENDVVIIHDIAASFSMNNLTVSRNGKTIMGLSEDLLLDVSNFRYTFLFINNDWRVW